MVLVRLLEDARRGASILTRLQQVELGGHDLNEDLDLVYWLAALHRLTAISVRIVYSHSLALKKAPNFSTLTEVNYIGCNFSVDDLDSVLQALHSLRDFVHKWTRLETERNGFPIQTASSLQSSVFIQRDYHIYTSEPHLSPRLRHADHYTSRPPKLD